MQHGARPIDEVSRENQVVYLHDAKWADYQRLLRIRGERQHPRITFLEGTIEIMSPSENHEQIKSLIGCLLEVYLDVFDIEFTITGSWTIKKREKEAGAEPGESYLFGPSRPHTAPDLAIEVAWSNSGMSKLEVYARLGVREVWYWRGGVIEAYVLRAGRYVRAAKSHALPKLDLTQLAKFAARSGTTSQVRRAYRKALTRNK